MASTLIQPHNNPSSSSKLPIKRKTPDPNPPPLDPIDGRPPPFKFHRIWTEPDEIRFLQGLLDCASQNLAFPRDLGIFYARFSNTMSQPYTKSQLSEKLRRLRKKFRVISSRLSKGLDRSQLSLHDRELYDLSNHLWHPDYAATSPFSGARNVGANHSIYNDRSDANGGDGDGNLKKLDLVGVKVDFSPTLPVIMPGFDRENDVKDPNSELDCEEGRIACGDDCDEGEQEEIKLSDVNVEFEGEEEGEAVMEDEGNDTFGGRTEAMKVGSTAQNIDYSCDNEIGEVAAKVVISVFDECFKDVRRRLLAGPGGEGVGAESFEVRWQQQRIAELDVLGSRLRLVLEHSLQKH